MDEADLTIAAVIRQARILLGYTQMQVAEFSDMSFGEYQRIEYGQRSIRNVSMKHSLALCQALNLDPYLLVFGRSYF